MFERNVWCITHSDLDGMASGAVVKQRYPKANIMITNYGRQRSLWKIKPGDLVLVTDFSLTLDEFQRLRQKGCSLVHVDHHESNYKELEAQGWDCPGIRRADYCGAALTWMFFHPDLPPEAMPEVIKLVNDYDLWKFEDPRTKAFSYGSGLWDIRPGNPAGDQFWADMFSNDDRRFKLVIKYGEHIVKYLEIMQDILCKDLAYYTTVPTPEGPKQVLAMTVRAGNSSVFDRMNKDGLDAVFTGQYVANIGAYRCSMYSPDNVKEILDIVKLFGGGGHPKAAGFQTQVYPIPTPAVKEYRPLLEVLDEYKRLDDLRSGSVILRQWIDRSAGINLKAQGFHTELCNLPVLAVNHQYLPQLVNMSSTASDCINPKTSVPAKAYFGWCMSNTGWFRCCLTPTDTSTSVEQLLDAVKKCLPGSEQSAIIKDNYVWWYSRECPVHPPITLQQQPQQARM